MAHAPKIARADPATNPTTWCTHKGFPRWPEKASTPKSGRLSSRREAANRLTTRRPRRRGERWRIR